MCRDQLLYTQPATATSYHTLAALLDDDQLFVDTSKTNCQSYFAVELAALGIPAADCGGFTPAA